MNHPIELPPYRDDETIRGLRTYADRLAILAEGGEVQVHEKGGSRTATRTIAPEADPEMAAYYRSEVAKYRAAIAALEALPRVADLRDDDPPAAREVAA